MIHVSREILLTFFDELEKLNISRIIHIKSCKCSTDCPDKYFRSSIIVIPFFDDFINVLKELLINTIVLFIIITKLCHILVILICTLIFWIWIHYSLN